MAFADPQSITINGTAVSLPRTKFGPTGEFTSADQQYSLRIMPTSTKSRARRELRIVHNQVVVDPLASDRSIPISSSVYVVVDTPLVGESTTNVALLLTSLKDYLAAAGNITRVVNGEL